MNVRKPLSGEGHEAVQLTQRLGLVAFDHLSGAYFWTGRGLEAALRLGIAALHRPQTRKEAARLHELLASIDLGVPEQFRDPGRDGRLYRRGDALGGQGWIYCAACDRLSFHPEDARNWYLACCKRFANSPFEILHGPPAAAPERLEQPDSPIGVAPDPEPLAQNCGGGPGTKGGIFLAHFHKRMAENPGKMTCRAHPKLVRQLFKELEELEELSAIRGGPGEAIPTPLSLYGVHVYPDPACRLAELRFGS